MRQLFICLLCYMAMPAIAHGATIHWLAFAQFGEANKNIQIGEKSASFKTGAAGLALNWEPIEALSLTVGYGLGELPNQDMSYAGAQVSGDTSTSMSFLSAEYWRPISGPYGVRVEAARVLHDYDGDFDGLRNATPVSAYVDGHFYLSRASLGGTYQINDYWRLGAGMGRFKWNVSADASGTLGTNIRAQTTARDRGTDNYHYIDLATVIGKRSIITFELRRMELTSSNQVHVMEGQLSFKRPF